MVVVAGHWLGRPGERLAAFRRASCRSVGGLVGSRLIALTNAGIVCELRGRDKKPDYFTNLGNRKLTFAD